MSPLQVVVKRRISCHMAQWKERERGLAYVGMFVSFNSDHMLHVRRLRWKLRGSKKVDLDGGDRVLIS
jgi:hypothetical protein